MPPRVQEWAGVKLEGTAGQITSHVRLTAGEHRFLATTKPARNLRSSRVYREDILDKEYDLNSMKTSLIGLTCIRKASLEVVPAWQYLERRSKSPLTRMNNKSNELEDVARSAVRQGV